MLDLKLLEEVVPDIEYKTYGDLQEIKLLTEQEVKDISRKNENDDLCQQDILNLCVTVMHHMKAKNTLQLRKEDIFPNREVRKEPYVSSGTPLPVKFSETTGVDKCVPVTCEN